MKLKNNRKSACFFPYAGASKRGVNLGPGALSPDLPVARLLRPQVQRDLKSGIIEAYLTPADHAALRGMASQDILDLVEVGDIPAPKPVKTTPAAAAPTPAPKEDKGPDKVVEKKPEPKPAIDVIRAEILNGLTTAADAAQYMNTLIKGNNPQVAKIAEEMLKEAAVKDIVDKSLEVEEPVEEDVEEAVEEPAAEDTPDEVSEDPTDEEETEEDVPVETYRKKPYHRKEVVLSECVKRGLDVEPGMSITKLREALMADDANKA
jgi:hypothetical protein